MAVSLRPSEHYEKKQKNPRVLLIACGALAREIFDLTEKNNWTGFDIQCLPAKWHNTPEMIVPGVAAILDKTRGEYAKTFVLYGDCGTGGQLDTLLAREGIERIAGPHCYAFFSGNQDFATRAEEEFTAFYLTDYLARHFDKLIWEGLGLDRHPELLSDYFRHYSKLVYLAQTNDKDLRERAESAARKLGLAYEYRFTGYGELQSDMKRLAE
jgi:hypothetical protein